MSQGSQSSPDQFDLPGTIRRARRVVDLSQMELADRLGVARSTVARWESGEKVPSLERLQQILALAGLALVAVTEDGVRVPPMRANAVRDLGRRRFPAHLDVLATDGTDHLGGHTPQLGRAPRRRRRVRHLTAEDGQVPDPGAKLLPDRLNNDHPTEADVHAERREVRARRKEEARQRRQAIEDARRARGIPPALPQCLCIDACYLDCFCVLGCPCQCDSAPGWDWGETCALPRRPQDRKPGGRDR